VTLQALQGLAAGEGEGGVRQHCDGHGIAVAAELGEGTREEVVARCARRSGAVRRPGRSVAAPHGGTVDQVVVHERRHVHELDGDARRDGRRGVRGGGEEREQRPQALASGRERFRADVGHDTGVAPDGCGQPLLDLLQVRVQTWQSPHVGERGHARAPTCRATIPPAISS
jgi:hypothetical protein